MMNTTTQNRVHTKVDGYSVNSEEFSSLVLILFFAVVFTVLLAFNRTFFSTLFVVGFGAFGLYSLSKHNYEGWFLVVCFFSGAESILRNGLPVAYMFFYFYLVGSGVLFIFIHSPGQRFAIFSATGLIFLLMLLQFMHVDIEELRFGLGKWGLIWAGLFFGMWIAQSVKLNVSFYRCISYYMVGSVTVLFSFLQSPHYFDGRYWPEFDGTGPVAAAIGILVLVIVQQINFKSFFFARNILLYGLLILSIGALVMLGSRGTFLGLAVALLFSIYITRGLFKKILVFFSIVIMGGFVYYFDSSSIGNKTLSSRIDEVSEEDSREGRKFINLAVLLSFPEDPIFGKGTGSWRHYNNQYIAAVFDRRYSKNVIMADAHNTPLHLLFEHGSVGAALFLGAVFLLLKRGYTLFNYTHIFVFQMALYSFTLGLTTMHKQSAMFLPFLLGVMILYRKPVARNSTSVIIK